MFTLGDRAAEAAKATAEFNKLDESMVWLLTTAYLQGANEEKLLAYGCEGTFGQAIEALKVGFKVARRGWNGKDMFLWLKPSATVKSEWCKDPYLKSLADANGGTIEALGTICMKTADGKILTGWLASQTDILSSDWFIVYK